MNGSLRQVSGRAGTLLAVATALALGAGGKLVLGEMVGVARPVPVLGFFYQPASYRVGVDVVDLFPHVGGRPEIVVVPAAALPEAQREPNLPLMLKIPSG